MKSYLTGVPARVPLRPHLIQPYPNLPQQLLKYIHGHSRSALNSLHKRTEKARRTSQGSELGNLVPFELVMSAMGAAES